MNKYKWAKYRDRKRIFISTRINNKNIQLQHLLLGKPKNINEKIQAQYEDMFVKIQDALNEYDAKKAIEDSKTIIHKIAIKDGQINYETKGEVDGRLLNQFSMDEYNGKKIRVVVTQASYKDSVLGIEKVIPEGKKEMAYADYLRGKR